MFTPRCLNNALRNIHERVVRLIHRDHEKLFNSTLIKNIDRKTFYKEASNFLQLKFKNIEMQNLSTINIAFIS